MAYSLSVKIRVKPSELGCQAAFGYSRQYGCNPPRVTNYGNATTFQRPCCVSAVTFRPVQYARFRNANCVPTLAIDRSLWLADSVTHVSGMDRCLLAPRIRQIRALDGARGPSVNGLLLTPSRVLLFAQAPRIGPSISNRSSIAS